MYSALRNYLQNWLFQLRGPQTGAVILVQRRIFILPTREGLLFGGVLALMLIGSINYALSLGFVLTFLLAGLGVNAMVYTFRNLARLRVSAGRAQPVFAGGTARFPICIENPSRAERFALALRAGKRDPLYVDVGTRQASVALLALPAPRRGRMRPGRLVLFTRYPLGLYYAWSYLEFDTHCVVYPRPAAAGLPLPMVETAGVNGIVLGPGHEDFTGLRQYHPGDSPRHIAWKAVARGQELLTKQFGGPTATEVWLDWMQLPDALGVEERLSHLARWVLDSHAAGMAYGLRIPGRTVSPAHGDAQCERCLQALALYGLGEDDAYDAGGG